MAGSGLVRTSQVAPVAFGLAAAAVSALVLAGWMFGIDAFTAPVEGLPPMRVATAFGILLLGAAAAMSVRRDLAPPLYMALGVAVLKALLSLARDQAWLPAGAPALPRPLDAAFGPMAPLTSFSILLLSASVVVRRVAGRGPGAVAGVLSLCCLVLLAAAGGGVASWLWQGQEGALLWSQAPHTVLGLSLVAAGLFLGSLPRFVPAGRIPQRGLVVGSALAFGTASVLVWGFVTWTDYRDTRADAEIQASNLARVLEEHIRRSLDSADLTLRRLTEDVAARGIPAVAGSQTDWQRIRTLVDELPQLSSVGIVDADGNMRLLSTRFPFPPANFAYRDYFVAHRDGVERYLGPMIITGTTRKLAFTYSRRISGADGEFAGVLLATMEMDYFLDFYRSLNLPDGATVALFRRDGKPLAREPMAESLLGMDLSRHPLFAEHIANAVTGMVVDVSPIDGTDRLVAFRRADDLSLVVLATLDLRQLISGFEARFLASASVLTVVLLVLGISMSMQLRAFRREMEARRSVEASRDFAQAVMDSVAPHIAILDRDGHVVGVNKAWRQFARENGAADPGAFVGKPYLDICAGVDGEEGEQSRAAAAGIASVILGALPSFEQLYPCHGPAERRWFKMRVTPLRHSDGSVVVSHENVTDLKLAEEALQFAAATDALTGLANRRAFIDAAERAFAAARRSGRQLAVLMLDCDRFKSVNDRFGHEVGDRVLRELGDAMTEGVRGSDLPARFGGEEFVVLLPDTGTDGAWQLAERLRQDIAARRVEASGNAVSFTVSIGVAVTDATTQGIAQLLREADAAMYRAKMAGRNRTEMADGRVAEVETAG